MGRVMGKLTVPESQAAKLVDELGGNRRSPKNPDEIDNMAVRFEQAVNAFREMFPKDWDALKLCPLQHGVVEIAAKLKG